MFTQAFRHVVGRVAAWSLLPLLACVLAAPMQQTQAPYQRPVNPYPVHSITQTYTYSLTSTPTSPQGTVDVTIGWYASSPPVFLAADLHCYDGETVTPQFQLPEFVPGSTGGFFEWKGLDPGAIYTANLTAGFPDGGVAEAAPLYF